MQGFDPSAILLNPEFASMLRHGLLMTFAVAVGSWCLAMSLGIGLLGIRLTPSRIADAAVAAYVSYHRSVPSGQSEAARALGHGYVGSMRYILMPQALRNALPALINHSVSLFKNSSLAMAIGVAELTHAVKEVENQSFRTFEVYLIATIAYLICSLLIMSAGAALSRQAVLKGER